MLRNLVTSLLEHERIETTVSKAKEARRVAERMITLGKKGTLHARRRAASVILKKSVVKKLFDEIAPRYEDRNGGYTRILRVGYRKGDGAPLAFLELVTEEVSGKKKSKKAHHKKAVSKPAEKTRAGKESQEKKEEEIEAVSETIPDTAPQSEAMEVDQQAPEGEKGE